MSNAPSKEPTVASFVMARGLQTLDVETSHKIVRAVASMLRRMKQNVTADALNVAVSTLWNAASSDVDTVVIAAEVWRRVKDGTGYGSFECDEHVAQAVEELCKNARDPYGVANDLDGLRIDLAKALGIEGDPEILDLPSTIRGFKVEFDALVVAADKAASERNALIHMLEEEVGGTFEGRSWRDQLRALRLAGSENEQLKTELADAKELASIALHDAAEDASGWAVPAGDEIGEIVDASFADALVTEEEPVVETPAGSGNPLVSPTLVKPAQAYDDSKPFREKTLDELKSDLGVVEPENPVRVSFATPAPKVPTIDDRIDAIRRLAEGESKADIASALGLKNALTVQGLTMTDKARIERVRRAAEHDRAGVLEQIKKEIEGAKSGR